MMKSLQLNPEVIIGECFSGEAGDQTVYLSVYCEQELDLTLRVENRRGQVVQTQTNRIAPDGDIIRIQIKACLPGKYTVWIYHHDQVWERTMIIHGSPQ